VAARIRFDYALMLGTLEAKDYYSNPASVVRFANLDSSFNSVALNVRIARIH